MGREAGAQGCDRVTVLCRHAREIRRVSRRKDLHCTQRSRTCPALGCDAGAASFARSAGASLRAVVGQQRRAQEHRFSSRPGLSGIFAARGSIAEQSHIHHAGYVGDDELAALYENALCLAFPSKTEGFGIPPLEAMTKGCPVISSNAASLVEVGGDAVVYVDPDDGP
jgi:glycosyltransferase involved in cell wall biosynthesis